METHVTHRRKDPLATTSGPMSDDDGALHEMTTRLEPHPITLPPSSGIDPSLTLDLPRESRRSFILRRDGSKDEAGAGYEFASGVLHLQLDGQGRIGTALRMNATSIWFEPESKKNVPYGEVVGVKLETSEGTFGPFQAKIGIDALNDDVHAVARLEQVTHADGQKLVAFMLAAAERNLANPVRPLAAVQTDITDPVRVRVVLQALAHRQATAVFTCGNTEAHASLTSFDEARGELFWSLLDLAEALKFDGPITAEVAGYNCVYHMQFASATPLAMGVITAIPERVDYNRYRRYRRAPVADSTVVRFEHPLWPEIPPFDRPLLDVSFGGIAFTADPLEDALYVGLRVDFIEIVSHKTDTILLRGTVRSLVRGPDGATTCGMSVEPRSPEFAESWTSFVMQALNQTTAPGDDHVEQLWELYTDSGYFNLSGKDPKEFDALERSFRSVVERTRTQPWVSYNSVWPCGKSIEASISTVKLYRNTWMLHQLAKRKATRGDPRARNILRDIYLRVIEYMQADAGCKWVLAYGEAHVRWMQRSHYAFAEHFEPTGTAISRSFRLMEARCRDRAEVTPIAMYRIAAAAPDERQIILDVLRSTLPQPYLEACDLVSERFDLAAVKRTWSDIGLERDREVWVARHRTNGPVAAAIIEVGETGTNLFRLLDSVRLVELQPGGASAFLGLIEKAKAWFLARGKDSFVYIYEHTDEHHIMAARLRDLGEGRVWIIPSELLPDFSELVCELTSHSGPPAPGRTDTRHDSAVPGPISVRGGFTLRMS